MLLWLRKVDIVEISGRKQKCMSSEERDYMWMGAVRKDMLLTLYVISIAQSHKKGRYCEPRSL